MFTLVKADIRNPLRCLLDSVKFRRALNSYKYI